MTQLYFDLLRNLVPEWTWSLRLIKADLYHRRTNLWEQVNLVNFVPIAQFAYQHYHA